MKSRKRREKSVQSKSRHDFVGFNEIKRVKSLQKIILLRFHKFLYFIFDLETCLYLLGILTVVKIEKYIRPADIQNASKMQAKQTITLSSSKIPLSFAYCLYYSTVSINSRHNNLIKYLIKPFGFTGIVLFIFKLGSITIYKDCFYYLIYKGCFYYLPFS